MTWHSEADAAAFAQQCALQWDVSNAIVDLRGDLGAGKTTFARHLLHALGVQGRIKSPSYTILEGYDTVWRGAPLAISHFDFYRFNDPQEWEDAGFRDVFAAPGLKLIEWSKNAQDLMPPADVVLDIALLPNDIREIKNWGQILINWDLTPIN